MSKVWEFVSCLSMADWPGGGGEGKNTQLGQAKMAEAGLLMVPDAALGQRRALFISLHKHSRSGPATPLHRNPYKAWGLRTNSDHGDAGGSPPPRKGQV